MNSRRLRAVSPLIILAVLSLQSCHGDDVHGRDVSKKETDEGGIFGFSFSPLSYLFGSDHGDGADEEKEIVDDVTTVKTAAQAGVEIDNADNQGDDRGVTNDMETAEAQEAGEKIKETGDDVSDTDRSADEVRDLDEEPASAADKGQPSMSADQDEVKSEIERLKKDAQLAEFIDEKQEAQPWNRHRKLSSAAKNTGLSKQMAASAPYNITSSAVSDANYCQHSPNMGDLSRYMRTCQNCLAQWDRYQCPLHEKVLELEKWMRELQDLLSYGCHMHDNCRGTDKCCHTRDPALERALDQMTQLARDMYNVFLESCSSCPRDGGWSDWCEWSACSVSCGEGTRTRSRACNNPAPKGNGRQCQGPPMDRTPCFGPACCMDGNWGPWDSWGTCSASCGQGTRARQRRCSSPAPNHCGKQCPGDSVQRGDCPDLPECEPICVPGNWGLWSMWSACPVSCGVGQRERRRLCNSPPPNECGQTCPGESTERTQQRCGPDQEDGNWGLWSAWSTCTVTCGMGQVERSRRCDSPPPNDCGRSCPGPAFERDLHRCGSEPEDGNWGLWSAWSTCTVTCDMGQVERRRRCDSPPPNDCGRSCPGPAFERDLHRCGSEPVDGNWGLWSMWSVCPVSCGVGHRERRRLCNSPPPNNCGQTCLGESTERTQQRCGPDQVDGNWGPWERWGACSVTCDKGVKDRRRRCDNPAPNYCGQSCPGLSADRDTCDTGVPCRVCVDGNWGLWSMWSACPVSCGVGQRERRRLCNSPPPNDCGQTCPGESTERTQQRCGPDQVDGNWGPWQPWSTCSVTCGIGQQLRRRRCDNPAANLCGRPCLGFDSDSKSCDPRPCCADRQWSLWSPWSTCSATCGTGTRRRERFCQSVGFGQACDITCPGSGFETTGCVGLQPCELPWGPWSPCSATCEGQGIRERRRQYAGVPGVLGVTSVETEPCRVFSPRCSEWGPWENWCPCDCQKGITSRRRNCVERMPSGQVVTVDAQQCAAGESREEKYCDVRKVCPVCVMNCDNRRDGNYSSCTSCRDYVNCKNGQMSILSCTVQHYEWDAFIAKCRQGGSPSCSLQPCVTSCTGRDDGPVPGCSGCSTYLQCRGGRDTEYQCPAGQEFNAHSGRCEVDMSPTCTRATIRSPAFMMGDAPADSYFDMEDEDAEERYQQLVKQTGVAAILHRDNHTVTLFKSQADGDKRDDKVDNYIKIIGDGRDKEKAKPSPRMSKKDKKEVTCQTDCTGLVPGLYQSCLGCDQYLVCTRHGATRFGRCPRNKRWDDKHKKCRKHSLTCNSTPGSKPNPGKS